MFIFSGFRAINMIISKRSLKHHKARITHGLTGSETQRRSSPTTTTTPSGGVSRLPLWPHLYTLTHHAPVAASSTSSGKPLAIISIWSMREEDKKWITRLLIIICGCVALKKVAWSAWIWKLSLFVIFHGAPTGVYTSKFRFDGLLARLPSVLLLISPPIPGVKYWRLVLVWGRRWRWGEGKACKKKLNK